MNNNQVDHILSMPSFQRLNRQRNFVRYALSAFVVGLHLFFLGGMTVYAEWFGQKITDSSAIPVGIVATVMVILLMLLSEAVYIVLSNRKFDPLQRDIMNEVAKNEV